MAETTTWLQNLAERYSANSAKRKSQKASKKLDKQLLNKYLYGKDFGLLTTNVSDNTKMDRLAVYKPKLTKLIKERNLKGATELAKTTREKFLSGNY